MTRSNFRATRIQGKYRWSTGDICIVPTFVLAFTTSGGRHQILLTHIPHFNFSPTTTRRFIDVASCILKNLANIKLGFFHATYPKYCLIIMINAQILLVFRHPAQQQTAKTTTKTASTDSNNSKTSHLQRSTIRLKPHRVIYVDEHITTIARSTQLLSQLN